MVTELCDRAAGLYPNINRDLMITGAILHDIGKIEEFQIGVLPDYTEIGKLVGHIVLAYELLSQEIKNMREEGLPFPELLEKMLKNMLLSHHGSLEFGSPVLPLFPEALLLHAMDDLDAKLYVFFNKIEEHEDNDNPFTPYDLYASSFIPPLSLFRAGGMKFSPAPGESNWLEALAWAVLVV